MSTFELGRPAWQAQASCRGVGPDLMFDDSNVGGLICPGCPVRQECGLWGLLHEKYGVWGGYTETELAALRALLGVAVETPGVTVDSRGHRGLMAVEASCGTTAGYHRHRRRGQTPCQACKDSHAAARTPNGRKGRRVGVG